MYNENIFQGPDKHPVSHIVASIFDKDWAPGESSRPSKMNWNSTLLTDLSSLVKLKKIRMTQL